MSPLKVTRSLHWVLKIGNLRRSIDFYSQVFGMKVLRHEEFDSGCDAQCNGDFDRPWSKTMIGYGNEQSHFSLELTYNYGIRGYRRGNDLKYISLFTTEDTLKKARDLGYDPQPMDDFGFTFNINGPDDVSYKCILREPNALPKEPFHSIALNVKNVEKSRQFWCDKLQMEKLFYDDDKCDYLRAAYGESVSLEFHKLNEGKDLDFGAAAGRIAFGLDNFSVYAMNDFIDQDRIVVPPISLSTEGKADVNVIILNDFDGFEACFVDQNEFNQLCTTKIGDDFIDWELRSSMNADKDKGQFVN